MVISESQNENYCTKISNENTTIFSDVIAASDNKDEFLGPYDLLCSSLASCLNITTRMLLERMDISYENVIVKVDLDSTDDKKTRFVYDVDITGDINEETKDIIMTKLDRCPIRKTLSKELEFVAL